jgi:hypothetical protein
MFRSPDLRRLDCLTRGKAPDRRIGAPPSLPGPPNAQMRLIGWSFLGCERSATTGRTRCVYTEGSKQRKGRLEGCDRRPRRLAISEAAVEGVTNLHVGLQATQSNYMGS